MSSVSQMLLRNVGKEVFILGNSLESSVNNCPFVVSKKIQVLRNHLERMKAVDEEGLLIAHGILTSAISIPNQMPSGTKAFVIVEEANKAYDSYVIQLDTIGQIISTVEILVNKKDFMGSVTTADELDDSLFEVDKQQIENALSAFEDDLEDTELR